MASTAHGASTAGRKPVFAIALFVGAVHLAALALLMWAYRPQLGANVRVVEGVPKTYRACSSKGCDEGIQIDDIVLACGVSVLAANFSCPQTFRPDVPARAVFFSMPTIVSSIGLSMPTRVLMRLEQGPTVLYDRDPDSLDRRYLFSSLTTWLVFVISSVVVTTLVARRT